MAFKFFKNGVEVTAPKRITWAFDEKPDSRFESAPEKLEINVSFWRKKLNLDKDATITILPTDGYEFELPTAEITKEEDDTTATPTAVDNSSDITSDNWTDPESGLPQITEDIIDTPKRGAKRKAVDVSDVSSELDNPNSTPAE